MGLHDLNLDLGGQRCKGMREAEEAIVIIFNPALSAASRAAAQEHCDKIKQAPGALAFACNLFDGSSVPEV